jgi:hypothetical protein
MINAAIGTDGLLLIHAAAGSSRHDFDFFKGNWRIRNKKLKSRLNNCTDWIEFEATGKMEIILLGMGNTDNFFATLDGKPFEGRTLRLFNPQTRLWSIYWADSNHGILDTPVKGSFENNTGQFYAADFFDGQPILVKFQWDKTDPDHPVWSQAFSADEGKTWEWNWFMHMERTE